MEIGICTNFTSAELAGERHALRERERESAPAESILAEITPQEPLQHV